MYGRYYFTDTVHIIMIIWQLCQIDNTQNGKKLGSDYQNNHIPRISNRLFWHYKYFYSPYLSGITAYDKPVLRCPGTTDFNTVKAGIVVETFGEWYLCYATLPKFWSKMYFLSTSADWNMNIGKYLNSIPVLKGLASSFHIINPLLYSFL